MDIIAATSFANPLVLPIPTPFAVGIQHSVPQGPCNVGFWGEPFLSLIAKESA